MIKINMNVLVCLAIEVFISIEKKLIDLVFEKKNNLG